MASSPISEVDIFDDFEEAKKMSSAACQQVPVSEYEEVVSSETDKALGELCKYLDDNPEVYARILRTRKQDAIESSGVVSFVKSKVMRLFQGDDYEEMLVSTSECLQQTNTLKAGLCKTFQYAQEIKGKENRHSKRLAAKRRSLGMKRTATPVRPKIENSSPTLDVSQKPSTRSLNASQKPGAGDSILITRSKAKARTVTPFVGGGKDGAMTPKGDCAKVEISPNSSSHQDTVDNSVWSNCSPNQSSQATTTRSCSSLAKSAEKMTFATPLGPCRKSLKRSVSNSSLNSVSSLGSMQNVHSQILCSNPISRLKATKIPRSPGGTPVRSAASERLPSEPLHKALVTAMRNKFKNVCTPSPRSRNMSLNDSTTSNGSGV